MESFVNLIDDEKRRWVQESCDMGEGFRGNPEQQAFALLLRVCLLVMMAAMLVRMFVRVMRFCSMLVLVLGIL